MKNIFILLLLLFSCQEKKINRKSELNIISENSQDSLFRLDIIKKDNSVKITKPKKINFSLPDSLAHIAPTLFEDFNADGKEDIMVDLGACGTAGCIHGIFLKQSHNFYKLAFMNYFKGGDFVKDKNGIISSIISYEEMEPYNPSKLYVSKYKFNRTRCFYELDTTYLYIDTEAINDTLQVSTAHSNLN